MDLKRLAISLEQELIVLEPELANASIQEKAIEKCISLLQKFDSHVFNYPFVSQQTEIEFFKEIRQVPQHNLIFYYKIRKFYLHAPEFELKALRKFITSEIKKVNDFFQDCREFIHYMDQAETYLDSIYFTREAIGPRKGHHNLDYLLTPSLHTSHDVPLSKLLAYRKYGKFLSKKLQCLSPPNGINANTNSEIPSLYWTGSKAGLTELVYSLYHAGTLNRGQADIREIATALERTFNFEIGDIYRNFAEIRYRKKSRTKFLDELSEKLIHAMDQDLE